MTSRADSEALMISPSYWLRAIMKITKPTSLHTSSENSTGVSDIMGRTASELR